MFLAAIVMAAVVTLSGCGLTDWAGKKVGEKIVEKGIESQTGAKVDINSDKGQSTISTKDGSVTFSEEGNAKIPDNFPKDIFIFSDAKVGLVMSGSAENKGASLSYATATSEADAFARYKQEMEKNGWKKDSEADFGTTGGKMLNFSKGNSKVMVTIGQGDDGSSAGKTSIGVILSFDEDNSTSSSGFGGSQE